jgi:hypothetical protein
MGLEEAHATDSQPPARGESKLDLTLYLSTSNGPVF